MKKYSIVTLLLFLGCTTHIVDPSDGYPASFIVFNVDDKEYKSPDWWISGLIFDLGFNHVKMSGSAPCAETKHRYGINIWFDTLAEGTYPIDSGCAYLSEPEYGGDYDFHFYESFGSAGDSISIEIDSVKKTVTGHFSFTATDGTDTLAVTDGAFIMNEIFFYPDWLNPP